MKQTTQTAAGCLFGLALGDSLAAPTEFIRDTAAIEARFGPGGPREPVGNPSLVTDDTQMTLAVGEALLQAIPQPYTLENTEEPLRQAFIAWMVSPDNTRAPGMTCLQACRNLMQEGIWQKATVLGSKGCGANMRVAPVGVLPGVDNVTRAALAQFQAALTHGHPTGLAASDLTAFAIANLVGRENDLASLPARLLDYARSQRRVYHFDWLGPLWDYSGADSPENYIERGWEECISVLERLQSAVTRGDRKADPCLSTGEGWIAEEALATGLLCFLLFPDDPIAVLRRAAVTAGDSDSIACLAGAFAGAFHGIAAWPDHWINRIEYHDRLAALGTRWDNPAALVAAP